MSPTLLVDNGPEEGNEKDEDSMDVDSDGDAEDEDDTEDEDYTEDVDDGEEDEEKEGDEEGEDDDNDGDESDVIDIDEYVCKTCGEQEVGHRYRSPRPRKACSYTHENETSNARLVVNKRAGFSSTGIQERTSEFCTLWIYDS